jgi:D-apionolactonase
MPLVAEPDGTQQLRVGRTGFMLDGADLRYLTLDGKELVRRLYVAVRDEEWTTREPEEVVTEVQRGEQEILIRAECIHTSPTAAIRWSIEAKVQADGAATYEAEFIPLSRFPFARIGICVLLPPPAVIDHRFTASTPAGEVAGEIANEIAPQWIEGQEIMPMFDSFWELRIEAPGHPLRLRFAGDLFEMEDQRNWSDGSFKIYGTPLSRPRPQQAEPNRPIAQQLQIEASADREAGSGTKRAGTDAVAEVELGGASELVMPGFGLSLEGAGAAAETVPLSDLGIDHIYLKLGGEDDRARLAEAAVAAAEVGASLHIAVRLGDSDVEALANLLAPHAEIVAWVQAFDPSGIGSGESVAALAGKLAPSLPRARFAGGTDLAFVDLNRTRQVFAELDGIAWAVDPQVHATDALTVIEALAPQADQIATAASFAPGAGALVGPIEMSPPPLLEANEGDRFATAWATASFATLAGAGALAATYRFRLPLARTGAWKGRPVIPVRSSEPLAVVGLAVEVDSGMELLLVNLRNRPTDTLIQRSTAGDPNRIRLEPYEVRVLAR